jgi:hypothetical protein
MLHDLLQQKILIKPWNLQSLHPSLPSPLEAIASLLLPTLPDCTSLSLSSLSFPPDFWTTRFKTLSSLSRDSFSLLSFSLHIPTVSDTSDFERLYLHALLCGVIGITCIDDNVIEESLLTDITKFFESSKILMKRWGVPTFLQPPCHLIIFDFRKDQTETDFLSSHKIGQDSRRVHLVKASTTKIGIVSAISALEVDIILQLLEDYRATATAGGDAQIVAPKGQLNSDTIVSSSAFIGRLSCGVDVALTTGLSQVSIVMGTAKRRLHARLLRRRGEAALLIGSHADAIDNFDKASKAAKASSDDLGLALIYEGRAAALYRRSLSVTSLTSMIFLQEVASSMREAIQHADSASTSLDISNSFLGMGSLQVLLRLRLANYLLFSLHNSGTMFPKEITRWMSQNGERSGCLESLIKASLEFEARGKSQDGYFHYNELRKLSSISGLQRDKTEVIINKSTISSSENITTSDGFLPFTEFGELLAKASILCATFVRPISQQIKCILLCGRLATQAGLRRKAEVLLLRASRLLRSLQTGLPPDVDKELGLFKSTSQTKRGGCVYAAAIQMQPLISLNNPSNLEDMSQEEEYDQLSWPWPYIHSSCMVSTQSLPLPVRSCSPSVLSASLTLSLLHGNESLTNFNGGCLNTSSLRRSAIADMFQSGELTIVLSLLTNEMNRKETLEDFIRLPSSSRMLTLFSTKNYEILPTLGIESLERTSTHNSSISSLTSSLITEILSNTQTTLHTAIWHRNACVNAIGLNNPLGLMFSILLFGFRVDSFMSISIAQSSLLLLSTLSETALLLSKHSFEKSTCCSITDSSAADEQDILSQNFMSVSPCPLFYKKYLSNVRKELQKYCTLHVNDSKTSISSSSSSSSSSVAFGTSDDIDIDNQGSPGAYASPRLVNGQGFEVWKFQDLVKSISDYLISSNDILEDTSNIKSKMSDIKAGPIMSESLKILGTDTVQPQRRISISTIPSATFVTAELPTIHGSSWLLS